MARDVVLVNGLPGSGKSSLGPRLAQALGADFLSKDRVKEALADLLPAAVPRLGVVAIETVYALAAELDSTVVIDSWWFRPRDLEFARDGLARTRAGSWVEVWCSVPAEVARARVLARHRPAFYQDAERLATEWDRWAAEAVPLGLGPVIEVDTTQPVALDPLCDRIKAALWR